MGPVEVAKVYGIHRVKLRQGVSAAEFERFAAGEFVPALRRLGVPGVEFHVGRADRGVDEGGYVFLMIFDSVETRNRYFPERLRASEELLALISPLRDLSERWEALSERDKTDFVVLDADVLTDPG